MAGAAVLAMQCGGRAVRSVGAPKAVPRRAGAAADRRWLALLVLLCIAVQALLVPAQRTAERAHVHRAPATVLRNAPAAAPASERTAVAARAAGGLFRHSVARLVDDHAGDHADDHDSHDHPATDAHHHAVGAPGVVYLDAPALPLSDAHAAHGSTQKKPVPHDADSLLRSAVGILAGTAAGAAPAAGDAHVRSRPVLPLERPPRLHG